MRNGRVPPDNLCLIEHEESAMNNLFNMFGLTGVINVFLAVELKIEPQWKRWLHQWWDMRFNVLLCMRMKIHHLTVFVHKWMQFIVAPQQFWTFQTICWTSTISEDHCNEQHIFCQTKLTYNKTFSTNPNLIGLQKRFCQCGLVLSVAIWAESL